MWIKCPDADGWRASLVKSPFRVHLRFRLSARGLAVLELNRLYAPYKERESNHSSSFFIALLDRLANNHQDPHSFLPQHKFNPTPHLNSTCASHSKKRFTPSFSAAGTLTKPTASAKTARKERIRIGPVVTTSPGTTSLARGASKGKGQGLD